jgi:hypothetical protein
METSLHSHIISLRLQERIAFAERERLAREVRGPRRPLLSRLRPPPRPAPPPGRWGGAGPA